MEKTINYISLERKEYQIVFVVTFLYSLFVFIDSLPLTNWLVRLTPVRAGLVQAATCSGIFGAGCHLIGQVWCRLPPPVPAYLVQTATCSGIFGAGCHLFRHIWCRLPPVPAGLVQAATCSCRFGAGFFFPQTGLVQTSSCLRILEVSYLIIMYFVAGCHLFT